MQYLCMITLKITYVFKDFLAANKINIDIDECILKLEQSLAKENFNFDEDSNILDGFKFKLQLRLQKLANKEVTKNMILNAYLNAFQIDAQCGYYHDFLNQIHNRRYKDCSIGTYSKIVEEHYYMYINEFIQEKMLMAILLMGQQILTSIQEVAAVLKIAKLI